MLEFVLRFDEKIQKELYVELSDRITLNNLYKMDKDYHIIAHDREILDSSMILVYDQHEEGEEEAQTPPVVDRNHLHFNHGLNTNQPEIVVQTNNEDFLMDTVKFRKVKDSSISASSTTEESKMKDGEKGGQDGDKGTVHPPSNITLAASSCGLDLAAEKTNTNTQESKQENGEGSKTGQANIGDICLSHRKENNLVIETGHEKETLGNGNQNRQSSENSLETEDRDSTVSHLQKLEDDSKKEEERQLYGEFIAKDDHVVLYKSDSNKEALSDDQPSAITARDDNRAIPVCSSLQFLNTGDSIVVFTQDPSNIGLTSTVSDMAIDGDRQIDLGQYELSTVPAEVNGLSMNIAESQPTFFQVELYSTGSLQAMNCQGPATVISAQQVLTVPQLFSCYWDGCNTHFLSKEDLVSHVTTQHAQPVRPQEYKCLWKGCTRDGKGFDARYKILTHLRSHTGERPHICVVEGCHKSFARLDNLKIHMRSHTGERPYRCPYEGCNKSYANSSDRFKHTRTHVEKKPYRCKFDGCDKSYTDPSSLRKHHRRHKNDGSKIVLTEKEPIVVLPAVDDEGEVIDVV